MKKKRDSFITSLSGDNLIPNSIHGPSLEKDQVKNYDTIKNILLRLKSLCIKETRSSNSRCEQVYQKPKKHEQRLLRNMRAHTVVLELLQIPYDKKEDARMKEIMKLAHEFLQSFCLGNQYNQVLLHSNLDLFLNHGILEAQTMCAIFKDNYSLCNEISERIIQHYIHCIETYGKHVQYLKFLQTIVKSEGMFLRKCQDMVMSEMDNSGEDVLLFYNDKASFNILIEMMRSEDHRKDDSGPLNYHIHLVHLLAKCTEGKNVFTEIRCHSLLSLDDIVRVVIHPECIPEVKDAYINFLNHCFIDTEVEMKEIYTSNHIWTLFENFLIDINTVTKDGRDSHAHNHHRGRSADRHPRDGHNHSDHAHGHSEVDHILENYVTLTIMNLIATFFNSPFSDQSSTVQVRFWRSNFLSLP